MKIQQLHTGDILAFNDPQTPEEILNFRNSGIKYMNYMLILDAPDDVDLDDLAERNIIGDNTIIAHGLDAHGNYQELNLEEWIDDNFRIVGHKNVDKILAGIFAGCTGKE